MPHDLSSPTTALTLAAVAFAAELQARLAATPCDSPHFMLCITNDQKGGMAVAYRLCDLCVPESLVKGTELPAVLDEFVRRRGWQREHGTAGR